jgi:hypothetical protein
VLDLHDTAKPLASLYDCDLVRERQQPHLHAP